MATKKEKKLGSDPLEWIRSTADAGGAAPSPDGEGASESGDWLSVEEAHDGAGNRATPKFQSFDVRLTVPLTAAHLDYLARIERLVMRRRGPSLRQERITKNSIIRAILTAFTRVKFDVEGIATEEELEKRMVEALSSAAGIDNGVKV